jgi:hypothetical protein
MDSAIDPDRKSSTRTAEFRVAEFDAVAASRSVAEVLRDNLEDAQAQLRLGQRLARRAERRVADLTRAVENWRDLLDDYERGGSRHYLN